MIQDRWNSAAVRFLGRVPLAEIMRAISGVTLPPGFESEYGLSVLIPDALSGAVGPDGGPAYECVTLIVSEGAKIPLDYHLCRETLCRMARSIARGLIHGLGGEIEERGFELDLESLLKTSRTIAAVRFLGHVPLAEIMRAISGVTLPPGLGSEYRLSVLVPDVLSGAVGPDGGPAYERVTLVVSKGTAGLNLDFEGNNLTLLAIARSIADRGLIRKLGGEIEERGFGPVREEDPTAYQSVAEAGRPTADEMTGRLRKILRKLWGGICNLF